MFIAFHSSFSTKTHGPIIHLKMLLDSSKVALAVSTVPSLEILSCS
jgi:hypothetical protein